jgi:CRP-like cAMP-binding protein
MILNDVPKMLLVQDQSLSHVRGLVAQILLEYARDRTTERHQLTQRDIAVLLGTDWETVHSSLKSLHEEGTIRIERHRIIINKELLQKEAGVA